MEDVKVRLDNLVTSIEYLRANSTSEIITINSLSHGAGIEVSFVDKNNKACKIIVFAGSVTPEVTTTAKIYRKS